MGSTPIVQAVVGALKSQQAELEVDWFLKDSREGNLEPALFAAFLYDHTVIFSGIAELAELDLDFGADEWPRSCDSVSKF